MIPRVITEIWGGNPVLKYKHFFEDISCASHATLKAQGLGQSLLKKNSPSNRAASPRSTHTNHLNVTFA